MRSYLIKQISSMGVVLPYDYKIANPPKIIPVVIFSNSQGNQLRDLLKYSDFQIDSFIDSPLNCSDLVFIRRNYDGSEFYYYVCDLTFDEILSLREFISEQKGGILL